MSWDQNYTPIRGSLLWSSLIAALPVAALLYAIGIRRVAAWKASLFGLAAAVLVALFAYRTPPGLVIDAGLYGAAFGAFPIFWIVYWALLLYRLTVDSGKFEILKNSIGQLTTDRNLQALLIAFAFGAFLSLQSISVAAAAAGLRAEEEHRLFRFTFKHSVLLASVVGLLALAYAYVRLS